MTNASSTTPTSAMNRGFSPMNLRRARLLGVCLLSATLSAACLHGATRTWTGGGADNTWANAANWDTGAPANGDSVLFNGVTRLQPTNNIANLILNGLSFSSSSFNLVGLSLTNNGGMLDNAGNNTNNVPQIMPVSQGITNNASLTLVNAGTINITNSGVNLWLGGAGTTFLNGVISGKGMLTLGNDSGTVRLGAANTFQGGVNINANFGTVLIGNAGAFPSGAGLGDVTNNSTINLNGTSITVNGLYGSGIIDNQTGTATYTVTVGNNSTNSAGNFSGGIQNSSGNVGLTKVNTNVFTFNGSGNYNGPTLISAGSLVLGASGGLFSTASITVSPGAVLDVSAQSGAFLLNSGQALNAGRTTNGGPSDVVGSFSSSGIINPLRSAAPGTMNINGGLTLNGGTLNFDLGNSVTLGSGVNDLIVLNGQLSINGATTVGLNPLAGTFANGTYTLISNATALVSGSAGNLSADLPRGLSATFDINTRPGSLLLTMSGTASPASLVWSGANNCDWDVRVTQNWLNGASADYFFNLDSVIFNDTAACTTVNLNNGVSPGSTIFANFATNYTISGSGAISGNGTLTVNGGGTVTLNTPNNYGGDTFVNNGSTLIAGVLPAAPHIVFYNGLATLGNLQLGGGGVYFSDEQNDTYRNNFNNLIINPGAGSLAERSRASSSSYIIQLNSVLRSAAGGTVDFNNVQSKASSPQVGLLITNTTTVNGHLGGFATFNATDWVVPVATGAGSTAYAAYQTSTTPTAWGVASNVSLTANPSANLNNTVINSLKLAGATVTINSGQSLALTSGGLLVPSGGAAATITGGTLLGATNLDLIVHEHSAVGTLTIGSVIADNTNAPATTGSLLTKSGQGTLILTGANTYTGPTYINGPSLQGPTTGLSATAPGTPNRFPAGTLQLGNGGTSGSISSSSGVTNNGNLAFNRSDAITFGLPISGNGGLKVLGGNVTLTGNNSYKGITTISAGTLQVGNGGTAGSLGNTASISDNGTLVFNRSDAVSYSGVISGLGSLTQQGAGTVTLGAADTYSGNTTVNAGTLVLGAGGSISNSATITVASTATFDASAAGGLTLNGAVGQGLLGTGTVKGNVTTTAGSSLNPAGTGTIGTLTLNNALGLNGGTYFFDISNGSRDQLNVGGNLALNGGLLQLNVVGSPLANGTYKLISYSGSLSGSVANLSVAGFNQGGQVANLSSATAGEIDLVVSSYVALNLTWRGDGVNNKWDVNTTADWINGGGASVFHNFDNALFDDTGSNTPPINLVGTLAPAVVTVNAVQDYTFSGNGLIDGGSSVVKNNSGNLFLLTTNNYTGSTTINAGTVQVGNGIVSGDIGTGSILDNASLIFNQPDSRTVPANISGAGQLTQQGSGTLTLLGNNSYGATTVASGVLQVGDGLNAGTLGSGPVTNNSTLILNRNGSLAVNNAITGSGMLIVNGPGTVNLGGANSYQNNTYISNGIVRLTASEVVPDGGTTTGWLILDGSPTVAGTFDLNGFNESVNGLAGLTDAVLGKVINNGGGTSTLYVNSIADTTFTGTIQDGAGKVALVKNGANTLTLQPGGNGSTFSGGTIISNGVVSGGNSITANATMLGGGPVTFYGGTLQLAGFTGSTSPDYGTFANPIIVPANVTATVFTTCRGNFSPSSVTGPANSTLILVARYVRDSFGGNWSGFSGQLIVSNNVNSGTPPNGPDFRLNTATGFPNARLYLATGPNRASYMYNIVTGTPTIPIGELTGDPGTAIALNSGASSGAPALWSVGGLNTSAQFDGDITDTHGIIKVGNGSWLLTSANLTFTGPTIVSNGVLVFGVSAAQPPSSTYTLAAPGKLDISSQGTLTVANMIQGNGTLLGSLVGNGTVMPGFSNAPGVLTVTNAVSLNGTTLINLNRTNSPNCGRLVAPTIAYGGTLTLANIGNTLLGGETFQAFSGALSGTFAATNLAALAPGLSWNLNNLAVNGSLSVVGQITPPLMGPAQVVGTTNIVGGTGGLAGATFRLLTSTNVASPLASWTQLGTGTFAADGSWSYTNIFATNSMLFYKVIEVLP